MNFLNKKKTNYDIKCAIDSITPTSISGWIHKRDCKFDEIRLIVGENLIAKADINIFRKDVCEFLNEEGCFGFLLNLDDIVPKNCIDLKPKIIANTLDFSKIFEIDTNKEELNFEEIWKSIIKNNLIGCKGYLDGLKSGKYIEGWAFRKKSNKKITVWLQCLNQEPIALICSNKRKKLFSNKIIANSGFSYNLDDLPTDWFGNQIWCSFDKGGKCKLPQNEKIILEKRLTEVAVYKDNDLDLNKEETKAFEDLNVHKEYLNKVKILLDTIDNQILNENNKKNFFIEKIYRIKESIRKK